MSCVNYIQDCTTCTQIENNETIRRIKVAWGFSCMSKLVSTSPLDVGMAVITMYALHAHHHPVHASVAFYASTIHTSLNINFLECFSLHN